jgi:hypothetical protein
MIITMFAHRFLLESLVCSGKTELTKHVMWYQRLLLGSMSTVVCTAAFTHQALMSNFISNAAHPSTGSREIHHLAFSPD